MTNSQNNELAILQQIARADHMTILFCCHGRAGGTERHMQDLLHLFSEQAEFLILRHVEYNNVSLQYTGRAGSFTLYFNMKKHYQRLLMILQYLRVDRIHYHHIVDLPLECLQLQQDLKIAYDVTLHDYYFYCPQVHLYDEHANYCGEPDLAACELCLKHRPIKNILTVATWRQTSAVFLQKANRVFSPSWAVTKRFLAYFPQINFITAPHPDGEYLDLSGEPVVQAFGEAPLKIAIIGAISINKGAELLQQVAHYAMQQQLPLEFHVVGYVLDEERFQMQPNIVVHGKYDDARLKFLLATINPHLAWFPMRSPETYCYTLSAAFMACLPVVVTDLGAFPERIAGRKWSWIKPWQMSANEWVKFFMQLREQNFLPGIAPEVVTEQETSRSHYRYKESYLVFSPKKLPIITSDKINAFLSYHLKYRPEFVRNMIHSSKHWVRLIVINFYKYTGIRWLAVKLMPEKIRMIYRKWLFKFMQ